MADRSRRRPPLGRWALRLVVVAYLGLLVAWPVGLVARSALDGGLANIRDILEEPDTVPRSGSPRLARVGRHNTVFGVGISLLLVRHRFPGRRLLGARRPAVGVAGRRRPRNSCSSTAAGRLAGPTLEDLGLQGLRPPGMVMATTFMALPLVVPRSSRSSKVGTEQEEAAHSLGAGLGHLPAHRTVDRWAVVYGVGSLARSLGEFGAVKVVSGNLLGQTRTATLVVEEKYLNFDKGGAYATAFLLALIAVACIVAVAALRPREGSDRT